MLSTNHYLKKTNVAFVAKITSREKAARSMSNYAVVGTTLPIVGESLCEALDLRAGSRVLDVAAGSGNAAFAAAHRWCDVTSTDDVPQLLAFGRKRARAEGLTVRFQKADAQNLPFCDRSFDVVLSTFGVMFAPDQEKAADELARVCKLGGRIGLANWTPDSFIGQVFRTIRRYVPPTPGTKSPARWGTQSRLWELFGEAATTIRATRRSLTFRYRSPLQWLEVFRTSYGPLNETFAALDPAHQQALTSDLLDLIERGNRSGDETLVLPSEYLEVVIQLG